MGRRSAALFRSSTGFDQLWPIKAPSPGVTSLDAAIVHPGKNGVRVRKQSLLPIYRRGMVGETPGTRLAGELEVAMHEGDRDAAFTDGCCHALH